MSDDRDFDRPAGGPVRFEAAVGSRLRAPAVVAAAAIAFVALAIVKPWTFGTAPAGPAAAVTADAPARDAGRATDTSPSATSKAVQAFCLDPGSWRTATIEQWAPDQTVRVWRAIEPRRASGPTDPGIDTVPAVGETVPAIGYCAPTGGPDRPSGPAAVAAWRVDGQVATSIDLRQIAPVGAVSELGALFGPPDARAASWPTGVYVFRFAELAVGDDPLWFAVEVRTDPPAKGGTGGGARATRPPPSEVMQPGGGLGAFFLP
jgi:hypothetical protein